jgi:hypothetical protein
MNYPSPFKVKNDLVSAVEKSRQALGHQQSILLSNPVRRARVHRLHDIMTASNVL